MTERSSPSAWRMRPRRLCIAFATFAIATGVAASAFGHALQTTGIPFVSTPMCTHGLALIADGNYGKGFARSNTDTSTFGLGYQCSYELDKAAGNITSAWEYFRMTNGNWAFCEWSNWQYNTTQAHHVEAYRNWANEPCTKGRYIVRSNNFAKLDGNWRGGQLWSPDHLFN